MTIEALIVACLLGAAVTVFAPNRVASRVALLASFVPLALSAWMYATFSGVGNALIDGTVAEGDVAFETTAEWVELGRYTLRWHVGLDGISMPLVALTTVLTSLAIVSSVSAIDERQSQFYGLMLFMEAGLLGVFSALDFFAWFVFWEGVLVPMYFLIGVWGGPRRKYAAIKFFVYTNVASLVMFVAYVSLVFALGPAVDSFDMVAVAGALRGGALAGALGLTADALALVAFVAMFFGFGVKVPVVPLHTWLPDAHVEAPTPVSVVLAGVLLKMGTYALLRYNFTMLAEVARRPTVAAAVALIAVVSVLYGAVLALAQSDLKRIVAYSSVSSMGYVLLGLVAYTVYGVGGATFQMVSHGLLSGLLFMTVGVVYNQTHTRMVEDMSGLADRMPVAAGVFVAGAFGYMGLPLMSGFAAEFFVFVGSFGADFPAAAAFTALSMFGIVVVAGYLLWAMQRSLFGPFRLETDYELERAPTRDVVPLLVLLGLVIALGVAPELVFGMIRGASEPLVEGAGAVGGEGAPAGLEAARDGVAVLGDDA
ncbi:oxidoreductase [Halobacteriales archaeon SW_7_71_33]|nr:MAG: oxidoreductase [Halobacteriales archaeon SW_7_71_33]